MFCYDLRMPRSATLSTEDVIDGAMRHFWQHGYHATSMDTLVDAIGASRHAIYSSVGGKEELYRRGFAAYQSAIVSPAFGMVESVSAGLDDITQYFEAQIVLAESVGLPGPGCMVANAMTETAPALPSIAAEVEAHHQRLRAGFRSALSNEGSTVGSHELDALADFLVLAAQGLWSLSRTVKSAHPLRAQVETILSLVRIRLNQ